MAKKITAKGKVKRKLIEGSVEVGLLLCALFSLGMLVLVFYFLLSNSFPFFSKVSPLDFLTGDYWNPFSANPSYGVLPLLTGTFLVTMIAGLIAIPIGIGCSIYISEIASPRMKGVLKPVIEVIAGIPSVVLGLFAVIVLADWVQTIFDPFSKLNALLAGLILAVMMIPIQVTIAEEAMNSVPRSLREASYALGATKWETIRHVVVPASLSGIVASIVLALGRAIGETMAVTMVAGNAAQVTTNPLYPVLTMPASLAIEIPEAVVGSNGYQALFAVGLLLFIITFAVNMIADVILVRYREAYK
ncbi:MAG: phosphate ABC transporter permease subunit PstC [Methanomassiliicoccales archaeon]|jgi:phosphate ABC transporter permease protein PstC